MNKLLVTLVLLVAVASGAYYYFQDEEGKTPLLGSDESSVNLLAYIYGPTPVCKTLDH